MAENDTSWERQKARRRVHKYINNSTGDERENEDILLYFYLRMTILTFKKREEICKEGHGVDLFIG